MKDFSLTKEELEEKLRELEKSRDGFDQLERVFACCYAPAAIPELEKPVPKACTECGNNFEITGMYGHGNASTLESYEEIAKDFRKLGYDAHIYYYCDTCITKKGLPKYGEYDEEDTHVFFAFKAKGADEYRLTPLRTTFCHEDDLLIALEFLKGAPNYQEIYNELAVVVDAVTADEYKDCITRVLGLELDS